MVTVLNRIGTFSKAEQTTQLQHFQIFWFQAMSDGHFSALENMYLSKISNGSFSNFSFSFVSAPFDFIFYFSAEIPMNIFTQHLQSSALV